MTTLAVLLAAPARAQSDPFADLGIPASSPYEAPGAKAAAKAGPPPEPVHPLEAALPALWEEDLSALLSARAELEAVLDYAAGRPQVFPPAPVVRSELFDEWRVEARAAWSRALDLLSLVDARAARYAEAPRLKGRAARAQALTALALAFTTRARFMRRFSAYGGRDPLLAALFDEPVAASGLGPGAASALAARAAAPGGDVRAAWSAFGGARALPKGAASALAARAVESDLKALRVPAARRASLEAAAAAAAPAFPFGPDYAVAPASASERPALAFLPPVPEGEMTVSSRAAYAHDTLLRWFRLDASTAPVPLSRREAADWAERLRPGDVLLARRGPWGAPGQGGWWDAAGVYMGDDAQRRAASGDDSLSAELRALAPALTQTSTDAARLDLPSVVETRADGTRVRTLSAFAAGDAVAALRPRADAPAVVDALRRAASLVGRPYDPAQRPGGDAVAEGELVQRAWAALKLPEEPAAGPRAASPNGLAALFDASFGTPRCPFDFVAGLRPGAEAEDRTLTLEAFRASTRRGRWSPEAPKEKQP